MRKAGLTLFILLAGLTLAALAVDAMQSDWSAGDGEPGPLDHWGRKFDTEINIDYAGTPGELSLMTLEPETMIEKILEHPLCVVAARIDADEDMDVVVCSEDYSMVDWFDNLDGVGGSWDFHNVVWAGAQCLDPADVDNDGDNDIFYATSGSVGWRANDGSGGTWTNHSVGSASGVSSIFTADIDGDGDVDVVATMGTSGAVTWWSNDDGSGGSWTSHAIATGFTDAAGVCVADVDGDSDLDVIAGGGSSITWWSNDGGAGASWTQHLVYTGENISSVAAADIDGDTDIDIATTSYTGNRLVWFSNDDGVGGTWTLQILQEDFVGAESVKIADLDGDSDMDVAAAAGGAGEVAWWENTAGDGSAFTEHVLNTEFGGANFVSIGDMNGDAIDDVICCALDISETRWWNTAPPPSYGNVISSILDISADTEWGWVLWSADTPTGTGVALSVRAADDSGNMGTWSEVSWGADLGETYPAMLDYLQYMPMLTTTDPQVSP
ncbi:MAG: VCBS repeat-containing protein, partial [bacterium]|nr:VCBS repeat-containing protein [bacterium]